jgi:predicted Zn-dependent protease
LLKGRSVTSPIDFDATSGMLAAPLSATVSTAGLETFARHLHKGSELLRDGDPGGAREHLERALALFPDNVAARHLLALSLFQIGHLERALVLYEALLLEFPAGAAAKVNLAVVLLKLGRASAARPLLEDIVRASPDHRRAWGYLGVALEQLGLIAEAEGAFIAGHYSSAARRLRDRHAPSVLPPAAEVAPDAMHSALPAYRRRTLPPDPWSSAHAASTGTLAYSPLQRFAVTLRPPDLTGVRI